MRACAHVKNGKDAIGQNDILSANHFWRLNFHIPSRGILRLSRKEARGFELWDLGFAAY